MIIPKVDYKKILEEHCRESIVEMLVRAGLDKKEAAVRTQALIDNSVTTARNFEDIINSTPVIE